jgi:hypothetical protein
LICTVHVSLISNVSCDCNQQASARTDTANNAESKLEQPATKPSAKVKPQILEIEIVDLHDKRDLNFERFLLDRLQKPMTFQLSIVFGDKSFGDICQGTDKI